jgi:hypothetical protein
MPSLFDDTQAHNRQEIGFLRDLAVDIAKPVARDDRVHIEYVPTQIVAEYFRTIARVDDRPLDGIAWNSGVADGKSLVLFATPKSIERAARHTDSPWLRLIGVENRRR